jgi:hypothetical protein
MSSSKSPTAGTTALDPVSEAACIYLRRRERIEHPDGRKDNAGRWYPDETEMLDKTRYRSPSRAHPWPYMLACRTLKHCANLAGIPAQALEVRRAARRIEAEAALLGQTLHDRTDQILAERN